METVETMDRAAMAVVHEAAAVVKVAREGKNARAMPSCFKVCCLQPSFN